MTAAAPSPAAAPRPAAAPSDAPLPSSADAVIIGGGIFGCTTAWRLAQRGLRVVLLDRGVIGGGQSTRAWGFVRVQYRDPFEIPLMVEGLRIWPGLEAELGADLGWRREGCLFLAGSDREQAEMEAWVEEARPYQLGTRLLTAAEAATLIPGMTVPRWGGLFTANDGQAEPTLVTPAIARAAAAAGAVVRARCGVTAIERAGGRVIGVVTEQGPIRTDRILLCAGATTWRLLRPLGLSLPQQVVRSTVATTAPLPDLGGVAMTGMGFGMRQRRDGRVNLSPELGSTIDITLGSLRGARWYLPELWRQRHLFKLRPDPGFLRGTHEAPADASGNRHPALADRDREPRPDQGLMARTVSAFQGAIPRVGTVALERSWAGDIDVLPDGIPVIDRLASPQGLFVATGFSGHGFAMGPVVGRIMADWMTDQEPGQPLHGFRFSRFAEGDVKRAVGFG